MGSGSLSDQTEDLTGVFDDGDVACTGESITSRTASAPSRACTASTIVTGVTDGACSTWATGLTPISTETTRTTCAT